MRHMDDGELVRFVDGELAPADARRWEAHVARCAQCSREIDAIRSESGRLSDWLSLADFEADLETAAAAVTAPALAAAAPGTPTLTADPVTPTAVAARSAGHARRRDGSSGVYTAWLKAAVVVLLLAAPLAAFPGVRGWVVERMSREGGAVSETTSSVPASPVIRFEPAAGSFTVRFQGPTANGVLALERTAFGGGDEAVLRIEGSAEPVVAEHVLRILDAEPGTRLSLALPPAVTDVRVLMDDREVLVGGTEIDAGRIVPLDG